MLVLVGCGNGPSNGTVIDHGHRDAYVYWVPGIDVPGSCTLIGKVESCSAGVHVPGHLQPVPESWSLKLRTSSGHEGWRDVGHDAFDACATESHYPECAP